MNALDRTSGPVYTGRMRNVMRLLARLRGLYYRLFRPLLVGVRLLILDGEQVLLVRHSYESTWNLPGGTVKKGEVLEAAARREAAEELGAELGLLALFGVYTSFYEGKSDHIIVFVCRNAIVSGRKNLEVEQYAYFPLDALPPDLSPGTRRRLAEFQQENLSARFGVW